MWESKMAPLSGVLFALLLAASFLVDSNTEFMPAMDEVVLYLEDGPVAVMAAGYIRLLAAGALIWFSGSLFKQLSATDDDSGRLSTLAFGGGAVASAMMAVGSVAIVAAAERVWITGSVDPGAASALFDLAGIAVGNAAPIGFAVMIGAGGIVLLRGSDERRWTGWASVAIALGLISPYAWALLAVVLVWVPLAGIWIYRSDVRQEESLELA